MTTTHSKSQHDDDQDEVTVVEAAPDPDLARAAQLESQDSENAEFAEAEAKFAQKERIHAQHLMAEGNIADGARYAHDAVAHMHDAQSVMDHVDTDDATVEQLRDKKQRELSLSVREMSAQNLMTLRDAVSAVREYVENMSELDIRKLSHAAQLSDVVVEQKRQIILNTGTNIEITLNSVEQAHHEPYALVKDLVTFTTIAMELATHLPKLLELLKAFGQILLQFHF